MLRSVFSPFALSLLLLTGFPLVSHEGVACSVGRADWVKLNLDQIVERSTRVVYGWVESVAVERASGRVTATVQTVRSLKGAAVKRFDLVYRVQSCVESIPPRKHHYIFLDDGCTETGVGCITFIESEHADGDFRSRLAKLTRDQPQPSGAVVDQHDLLR